MLRSFAFLFLLPFSAQAIELKMPIGLVQSHQVEQGLATLNVPTGVWNGAEVPSIALTGQATTTTFHSNEIRKPEVVAAAVWPQLEAQGYDLALHCADQTCGGYDFRFSLPVLPPPQMFVDLGDYVFLSGMKNDGEGLWVLISRSLSQTHVQITHLRPSRTPVPTLPEALPTHAGGALETDLNTSGRHVLVDLTFDAGSARLDKENFASLQELGAYLTRHSDQSIALIGHTDSSGSHKANLDLSKQRAEAVRSMLLRQFPKISLTRVACEGIGYFAPLASNATAEGREINRRVEVILVPTAP
jgi:OOP family OmpA-OmpF porin